MILLVSRFNIEIATRIHLHECLVLMLCISIRFVVNLLLHILFRYPVFKVHGGTGNILTSDLTLIRRAL